MFIRRNGIIFGGIHRELTLCPQASKCIAYRRIKFLCMSAVCVASARLLPGLSASSDVLYTLMQNSVAIASSIRSEYLERTSYLIQSFGSIVKDPAGGFPKRDLSSYGAESSEQVARILESLRGRRVAALDGGQGKGLLGTTVPFVLRTVTFTVKLGDKSPSREHFSPSSFLVNRLSGGALGAGEQLLAAVQVIFELAAALRSVEEGQIDLLLLHGPMTRPFNVFLAESYNLSRLDMELPEILGRDLLPPFEKWRLSLSKSQQDLLLRFPSFGCMVFLVKELIEAARKKKAMVCGVVERTSSTELIQRLLFRNFSSIYERNKDWFSKVTGKQPTSPVDQYLKLFLDNLGYTDPLIFGAVLSSGEYTDWHESRANRYQEENREKYGLATGFIKSYQILSDLVPLTYYTYIRTSPFNAPFKVEIPDWLNDHEREQVIASIFAFSQFLPKYAFPVNLDVVDKLAKVPNWITNALMAMITQEIYEGIGTDPLRRTEEYSYLLAGKSRDWDLRPGVRRRLV